MTTTTTQDLAIKLFGSTIPLPHSHSQISLSIPNPLLNLDACNDLRKAEQSVSGTENYCPSERSSVLGDSEENQASNVTNKEELDLRSKEEQADGNCSEQERIFKKPDKIIPCPRCNSLETKFCYFNNYNVNQPRHFCKNCQRYWTAGGTMRNVPIGAGRRRNKQLASQYRQIIVSSEGVATTRLETSDSTNHHQLISCVESSSTTLRPSTGNGTVLKFGPEAPICESMETVLSLGDQKRGMEIGSAYCGDSPEEPSSCGSSMTTASIRGNELPKNVVEREAVRLSGSCSEITASNTMHHYPVPQLVFPMNQGGNGMVSSAVAQGSDCTSIPNASNHPNPVQWLPATMLAVPGFCTPSLPLQFVPASCWGCTPVWTGGAGNLAVLPSNGCASQTSPPAANGCCPTNPNPIPTLGKHSRDANSLAEEEKSKKCVVVPKTLRVDNPSEASRSPIWATLGIRPYQKETISSSTVFETSETNVDVKSQFMDASPILGAKTSSFYSHL